MSDAAVDSSSEITTKDLKEKEAGEEAENGRRAPANGNARNEENGEQEADNEVDEEEEEGGEEEEEEGDGEEEDGDEDEEAEAPAGKPVAEDDEGEDVDTKKQRLMRMTGQQTEKLTLRTVTYSPSTSVSEFKRGHLRVEKQALPTHCGQCHPQVTHALHHPTKTTT